MAVDKGKQFEYAIMREAYARMQGKSDAELRELQDLESKPITTEVANAAKDIFDNEILKGVSDKQSFYRTFSQLGGSRPEPKTDVLFVKNGKKYKCSMKYGEKFQLSSAGINSTMLVLTKVLKEVAQKHGARQNVQTYGEIALLIEQIGNLLDTGQKIAPGAQLKTRLNKAKGTGGLIEQLQEILGSRKNTQPSDVYMTFKKAVVKEALTGKHQFGSNDDRTANYVLTESYLKPIDDAYVANLANKVYVDIRLKGRGKEKGTGIRLNEIVVRLEPV